MTESTREIIPLDNRTRVKPDYGQQAKALVNKRAHYIYKNTKRGRSIKLPPGRFRPMFQAFMRIYVEELIAELVTGVSVWLPAKFGELSLYTDNTSKGYYAYHGGPRINYRVFLHWGHRYRFKFAKYIKLKMRSKGMFKKIVTYFQDNPDERSKLSQMQ